MFTEFGREIHKLRISNHDDVQNMAEKTGINHILIVNIEMGIAPLSVDILDKVLAAYKPNKSISDALRQAFIRTKIIEIGWERKIETKVYYWYAEPLQRDPFGRRFLNINECMLNGPFSRDMEAIEDADYWIKEDAAVVYVFCCLKKHYRSYSRAIAYNTVSLYYVRQSNLFFEFNNNFIFTEVEERFKKCLKKFYSDKKKIRKK